MFIHILNILGVTRNEYSFIHLKAITLFGGFFY
jgi:hypothetical protein